MRRSGFAPIASGLLLLTSGCESEATRMDREARQALTDQMIDPTSFLLRDLRRGTDGRSLCGAVNGKNRVGGYVGFVPFVIEKEAGGEAATYIRSIYDGTNMRELDAYDAAFLRVCETAQAKAARLEDDRMRDERLRAVLGEKDYKKLKAR